MMEANRPVDFVYGRVPSAEIGGGARVSLTKERACLSCGKWGLLPLRKSGRVSYCADCYALRYPESAKGRGYDAEMEAVRQFKPEKGRWAGKKINSKAEYGCGCRVVRRAVSGYAETTEYAGREIPAWLPDEPAVSACVACQGKGELVERPAAMYGRDYVHKPRFHDDYPDRAAIEAVFGTDGPPVGVRIEHLGATSNPDARNERDERIVDQVRRGKSTSTLAAESGLNDRQVRRVTKAARDNRKAVQVAYRLNTRRPNKARRRTLEYSLALIGQRRAWPALEGVDHHEVVTIYTQGARRLLQSARIQGRKEHEQMQAVPTDTELAADAMRLRLIALDLEGVARRLTERFPDNEAVTQAVDQFLAELPEM
jgi:hypothetical protein